MIKYLESRIEYFEECLKCVSGGNTKGKYRSLINELIKAIEVYEELMKKMRCKIDKRKMPEVWRDKVVD